MEAEQAYRLALRLRPSYVAAHNDLGFLLQGLGRYAEAAAHYEQALRAEPDHAQARPNLAWLRCAAPDASVRDGAEALRLAEQLEARDAGTLDLLAAARAEAGDFDGARAAARRPLEQAGDPALAADIARRLASYERELPYRFGE